MGSGSGLGLESTLYVVELGS